MNNARDPLVCTVHRKSQQSWLKKREREREREREKTQTLETREMRYPNVA